MEPSTSDSDECFCFCLQELPMGIGLQDTSHIQWKCNLGSTFRRPGTLHGASARPAARPWLWKSKVNAPIFQAATEAVEEGLARNSGKKESYPRLSSNIKAYLEEKRRKNEKVTLADPIYSLIQSQWHPTKNYPQTPADFKHRTAKQIWLQCKGCPRCGKLHEWNPRVADVTKTGGTHVCPYCDSRGGRFCSCRAVSTDPNLAREWHEDNPLPASEVSLGHQKKVKWRCSVCEHSWETRPAFRSNDGCGCPKCGKSQRLRHGTVADVRKDLVDEWMLSNEASPSEVTCGSGLSVQWKCAECSNEWSAVVKARALNGAKCPRCSASRHRFSARQFAKDSPAYQRLSSS